jgi:hypothetical protein
MVYCRWDIHPVYVATLKRDNVVSAAEAEENAEAICQAVNNHERLVQALKDMTLVADIFDCEAGLTQPFKEKLRTAKETIRNLDL